ncbi:MAG: DUF1638 domain-containing protein [Ilumatobacteraceae bacterium]|nr:DUF1638 domain-containing protein [Ilumatobacter sp.]MCB0985172.1 DUF1638 domain-containing protein [Ilumatobacter sp.]
MATPLVLACGALVAELRAVLAAAELDRAVEVRYLPANLHNRPERIVPALEALLADADPHGDRTVLVGYADCGTGGGLDRLLAERPNLRRLPGSHCYEFFAGTELFTALHDAEPGTLYLTDYLAKHFDALLWQGLGLDRHPELLPAYFGNYRRVVLLSQTERTDVRDAAAAAAERLGLAFEHRHVGLQPFSMAVSVQLRKVA